MRSKLFLMVASALLVISLAAEFREVKGWAIGDTSDSYLGDFGSSPNIQPIEDNLTNPSLHIYPHSKPKFPIDYSSGSPEAGDQVPCEVPAMADSAISTIPEFPSALILPLFIFAATIALVVFRTKHAIR
jgi:hypothetical protein